MGHPVFTGRQVLKILAIIEDACMGNQAQVQQAIASGALHDVFGGNYQDFDREMLREALGLRLKREPELLVIGEFPIWKTVEIPILSSEEWIARLEGNGQQVSNQAEYILRSKKEFRTLVSPVTLELVKAEVRALGFSGERPTTVSVWNRIRRLGALCPPEVGPASRLVAEAGDDYSIAMETIEDAAQDPVVFACYRRTGCRADGPYLGTDRVLPDREWWLEETLVFVRRKLGEEPVPVAEAA